MNQLSKQIQSTDLQRLQAIRKLDDTRYRVTLENAIQERDLQLLWVYFEDFIQGENPAVKESTLKAYRVNLDRFLAYAFDTAGLNVRKTSYRDAKAYRDYLQKPADIEVFKSKAVRVDGKVTKQRVSVGYKEVSLSAASIRQNLATVKQFYKMLIDNNMIEVSHFDLVKSPKQDKAGTIKHYTTDELKLLLASHECSDDLKTVILLGYHAGLRVSEIVNLQCSDIDLIQGKLQVTAAKSGRSNETVNMHLQLKVHLAAVMSDGCIDVVSYKHRQDIYRDICRLCKKVGVIPKGVHGLRHASGMEMLRKGKGKNLQAVSSHLRHSDLQTSTTYAHLSNEDIKTDVEMMESL